MTLQHQSSFISQLSSRKIHHRDATVTTNTIEDKLDDTINLQLKVPTRYSDYEFKKNFFIQPDKDVLGMEESKYAVSVGLPYRKEKNISLFQFKSSSDDNVMLPLVEFAHFERMFPQVIYKHLSQKFAKPTPVQAQSWPLLLSGKDMIGLAETGSGKTLAFAVPMLIHILHQMSFGKTVKDRKHPLKTGKGPIGIILAPTRELALQIESELHFLRNVDNVDILQMDQEDSDAVSRLSSLRIVCAVGGETRKKQIREALKGCELVVGTPGRVLDLLVEGVFDLSRTTYVVMDEADRMLEMGFQSQIRKIMMQVRPDRQCAMFSATWDRGVQSLSGAYLSDSYILSIGNATNSANADVKQEFRFMRETDKDESLVKLLEEIVQSAESKVLIFCNSKRSADEVVAMLRTEGWPSLSLHGDRTQAERHWVINEFKTGGTPILCATDVAARGLDIENIQCVVNFDMPSDISVYVHRIGRTGRAGKEGHSVTFFTPDDCFITGDLIDVLNKSKQEIPQQLHQLRDLVEEEGGKKRNQEKMNAERENDYRNDYQNEYEEDQQGADKFEDAESAGKKRKRSSNPKTKSKDQKKGNFAKSKKRFT